MLPNITHNQRIYKPFKTQDELFYATKASESTLVILFTIKKNGFEITDKEVIDIIKKSNYDTI